MRKYITQNQLDKLTENQKEKLREWLHKITRKEALKQADENHLKFLEQNPRSSVTPKVMFETHYLYLPQFDIVQLLDYFSNVGIKIENGDKWKVMVFWKVNTILEAKENELVDTLWNVVLQTL